jgi:predicted permease
LRRFWISAPEFLDLRRETKSWATLDAFTTGGANLAGREQPVRVTAAYVSGALLQSLGVAPVKGRLISPQDDAPGTPLTAVISYGLWQHAFGADPNILGRDIRHDSKKCTVVGVMPPGFSFPPGEVDAPEIWVPLQIDPARPGNRGGHYLFLLGRLKPGISLAHARQEFAAMVNHWGEEMTPNTHTFHPKFHTLVAFGFHDEVVRGVRAAMLMLLGAVGFVLLIGCVNVANLLLARAESRQREIAVRTAMGAGLSRLLRQFVAEGVALSVLGAVLGLLLAYAGVRLLSATNAGSIPRAGEIGIDGAVLLFALLVSVGTGIFFGLAPVVHTAGRSLAETLKASGGRSSSGVAAHAFRRVLVISELGLALVLLIGSGLMVRAFWKLQQVETGVIADDVLTMRVALPETVYSNAVKVNGFWARLQERLAAIPGAAEVSFASGLPPERAINANDTAIEGFVRGPDSPPQNVDYYQVVGHRYFETMGIRLIEGRFFDRRDGAGAPPTVIVNQTMARHFWSNQSPLGKRVQSSDTGPWRTVIGVVADVKNAGIDKPTGTELYFPYAQLGDGEATNAAYLLLKSGGDPAALATAARAAVHELDPALPVASVRTMDAVMAAAQSRPRFLSILLTLFSTVALVLAAVGIYGVISYSVAQRANEIGIRMAIGARPADILAMILSQGARLGIYGVLSGTVGALVATRLIRGLLFGISAFDPGTFAIMALLLAVVTLLACYVPARRATKVDPMTALRYE